MWLIKQVYLARFYHDNYNSSSTIHKVNDGGRNTLLIPLQKWSHGVTECRFNGHSTVMLVNIREDIRVSRNGSFVIWTIGNRWISGPIMWEKTHGMTSQIQCIPKYMYTVMFFFVFFLWRYHQLLVYSSISFRFASLTPGFVDCHNIRNVILLQ